MAGLFSMWCGGVDRERICARVGSANQGGRERSRVKTRIQNLESRIQKIGGSHARGRAHGKASFAWVEVGKGGKNQVPKWEKAVLASPNGEVSRLFPAFPTFSHLIFLGPKIQQTARREAGRKKRQIFSRF